ncbi:S-layer homology domain-containing protein [Dehalobacterium formicoaceticum]|uniref:S-layer homology domain-containing protein n=1 Tax=Dehalobacterium formicoaceticum TaxID=51515 RepID=A0ABT1Y1X0_9FIRM|nr:S-layer homology domain-containing protein [Dehalobacterium formicoaceticum]MCR6544845.1 S-layer homology domain-containing protein [Dehalobacterium formicoaceticum]
MKIKKSMLCCLLITLLLVFSGIVSASESVNFYKEAQQKTVIFYADNKNNLTHWQEIVGLTEAGENLQDDPWQLPEWNLDTLNEEAGVLDYLSLILSIDASGEDPANIEGRNLVAELAALQEDNGGFGAETMLTYWAMIALDRTNGNYNTEAAVAYLLGQQNESGGFSWTNKDQTPDTDSTGFALVALANHQDADGVEAAYAEAMDYLHCVQKETGGFGTDANALTENCESTASVILGLLAIEKDVTAVGWQKNNDNMIDALLRFQLSDGSFSHVANASSDLIATRFALMALAQVVESGNGGSGGSGEPGGDPSEEKTVRVRVEGHETNLADEKVTVTGTALDALKKAVGEEEVEDFDGWISRIKGEAGQTGIVEGINTNWLYYVIRDGEIEPGAFDLGSGGYKVKDGDEIVFYIGAADNTTWVGKTYLPQVSVSPANIKEGETVTITIGAKKYNWPDGLSDLTEEEKGVIGNYAVKVGETSYTSENGQVNIAYVTKGTINFTVSNSSDQGYPDVVTYNGSFIVQDKGNSGGGGGSGSSDDITVKVYIVGKGGAKDVLFGPDNVTISKKDTYGWTALGALDAAGLDWAASKDSEDLVVEIEGQKNQGQNGWMFKVNNTVPEVAAGVTKVKAGDKILWWYSMDAMDTHGPDWPSGASAGAGSVSVGTEEKITKSMVTAYIDNLVGLKENKLLNADKKMTAQEAVALKEELEKHNVSLSLDAGTEESFLSDGEVALLISAQALSQGGKIRLNEVGSADRPKQFAVKLVSSIYELASESAKFNQSAIIAIRTPFTDGLEMKQIFPAWYNEESEMWVPVPGIIDMETGLVVFRVDHFTKIAVLQLPEGKSFSDVDESMAWAKDAIEILAGQGYISGTGGGFEPKRSINRGEFVKIMVASAGLEPQVYGNGLFKDVKADDWFAGYVQQAYDMNIITGEGGNFRPKDNITRNEAAAIFYRMQEKAPIADQNLSLNFKDAKGIPTWAVPGIHFVHEQGLMTGYEDNTFRGGNFLTRVEAAVTVYRYLGAEGN